MQERSPINVKNVNMPSVGFQVFKPIRESTIERNPTSMVRHVRVLVRSYVFIIVTEFLQEKSHTDLRSMGEMSGKAHIVKLL